ncbi:MAG: hypothetical protein QXJ06_06170 [Candidatus Aenigmatarchaeota archaeon]
MEKVLALEKNPLFIQLYEELKYSLNSMKEKDLLRIFFALIKDSAIDTYKNKKDIVNAVTEFSKEKINYYKQAGIRKAFEEDFIKVKNFINNLPAAIKEKAELFRSLSKEEKVEVLISIVMGIIIFSIAAGGSDFEGGIPDLDIKIGGLGFNRSIWFHSIISGFTFEFLLRLSYKIINNVIEHLPENHHESWDKIKEFIEKNKNMTIAALWAGIAAHLIKDTGLIAGNFKSYSDLPVGLDMEYHKTFMSANGIASSIFAAKNINNSGK